MLDLEVKKSGNNSTVLQNPIPGLKIHPNPADGYLKIQSEHQSVKQVKILNTLGQVELIKNPENPNSAGLSVDHLPKGIYLLEITGEGGKKATRKLIKR